MTDTAPLPVISADMLAAPPPDVRLPQPGQPVQIPGDLILITQAPNGTLAIEITATEARIYSDTMPHPEDWQLACGLLRWLGATPHALSDGPEFEGDMDVWTAQINPFRVRRSFYP